MVWCRCKWLNPGSEARYAYPAAGHFMLFKVITSSFFDINFEVNVFCTWSERKIGLLWKGSRTGRVTQKPIVFLIQKPVMYWGIWDWSALEDCAHFPMLASRVPATCQPLVQYWFRRKKDCRQQGIGQSFPLVRIKSFRLNYLEWLTDIRHFPSTLVIMTKNVSRNFSALNQTQPLYNRICMNRDQLCRKPINSLPEYFQTGIIFRRS